MTGLAHICLVTQCMTITRAKIEQNIPRKRKGSCTQHEKVCGESFKTVVLFLYVCTKSLMKFYETVLQAIVRHIRFDVVKCILVASPGFVKVTVCCNHLWELTSLILYRINSSII